MSRKYLPRFVSFSSQVADIIWHSFNECVCVCVLNDVRLFATPWTIMEFSRQEYWSVLPFPTPGDLPTQGSNSRLMSLLHWQEGSILLMPPGKPSFHTAFICYILSSYSESLAFLVQDYIFRFIYAHICNFTLTFVSHNISRTTSLASLCKGTRISRIPV